MRVTLLYQAKERRRGGSSEEGKETCVVMFLICAVKIKFMKNLLVIGPMIVTCTAAEKILRRKRSMREYQK